MDEERKLEAFFEAETSQVDVRPGLWERIRVDSGAKARCSWWSRLEVVAACLLFAVALVVWQGGHWFSTAGGEGRLVIPPYAEELAESYVSERYDDQELVQTLQYHLYEQYGQGEVLIFSYRLGESELAPGLRDERIAVLISFERESGFRGGGAVGTIAAVDQDSVAVAWTWLGKPARSDYAFYGLIQVERAARVELTERDGTVSYAKVNKQGAFYVPRPFTAGPQDAWPDQLPDRLRVFDAGGKVIAERTYD